MGIVIDVPHVVIWDARKARLWASLSAIPFEPVSGWHLGCAVRWYGDQRSARTVYRRQNG